MRRSDSSAPGSTTAPCVFVVDKGSDPRPTIAEDVRLRAGEIAYPVAAGRPVRGDGYGLVAGAAFALLLGGATFFSLAPQHPAPDRPAAPAAVAAPAPAAPLFADMPAMPPPPVRAATPDAPLVASSPDLPAEAPPSTSKQDDIAPDDQPAVTAQALPQPDRPSILVLDDGPAPGDAPGRGASRPANGGAAQSAMRAADPGAMLPEGTPIPAVLETALDTRRPGYARAVVTGDVASFDRSRILIPRASQLIGEYRSDPAAGRERITVAWTRLLRPDGVAIAIAPPAAPSGDAALRSVVAPGKTLRVVAARDLDFSGIAGA